MQYWEALKLCIEQHVMVSEDLVEKLTPGKELSDNEERNRILEGIAEVCMQQRQYHLATKKYTQAGNRVKVSVQCEQDAAMRDGVHGMRPRYRCSCVLERHWRRKSHVSG